MNTTYRRLTVTEWEEISRGIWTYEKFAAIARRLGRPTSAVSREVWNNTKYRWCYRAEKAQEKSQRIRHSGGRNKKLYLRASSRRVVPRRNCQPHQTRLSSRQNHADIPRNHLPAPVLPAEGP